MSAADAGEESRMRYHDDIKIIRAYGTSIGPYYHCRRCGQVWGEYGPGGGLVGPSRGGPCRDDEAPNWVGEGVYVP